MHKKLVLIISFSLIIVMLFTSVSLASGNSEETLEHAVVLNNLGLFNGTDNGYELDKTPTRIQGLVMLIRLLGEENEALASSSTHTFSDVPIWADKYVGYAIEKGYTKGTSSTTFTPDDRLDAKSYVTFILRSLNYDDSKNDFSWNTALTDAANLGLMTEEASKMLSSAIINRGDMVDLSYCALTQLLKGENKTLAERLVERGVFTSVAGKQNGVIGARKIYTYTPFDNSTIDYYKKTYTLASGKVTSDVLTVNLLNPKVSVRSALVNNTVGSTAAFSKIVANSGAKAVINSNFFQAYDSFKIPIGHVVCNGQFMYGVSGLPSFGITSDNKVTVGNPAFFYRVAVPGSSSKNWPCYELNSVQQANFNSVVYTPAFGPNLKVTCNGTAVIIENDTVISIAPCYAGSNIPIPSNGYIMWLGSEYTSTDYYRAPAVGDKVKLTPYLFKEDAEGFSFNNVVSVVTGAPRLVKKGVIETYLDPGFTEARFTTSTTPRTAIGTLANGKLVLVSVASATIQQMRELMLSLGCIDALNLDGGGSCAMYYNGSYIRSPGRELTTTLQVFIDD